MGTIVYRIIKNREILKQVSQNIIRNLKNSNYKFLFCYYRFIFCYYNFSRGYKMLIIIYLPNLNYFKK